MENYKGITEVDIFKHKLKTFTFVYWYDLQSLSTPHFYLVQVHFIGCWVDISMVVIVMSLIKVNVLAGVTRVTSTFSPIPHASLLLNLNMPPLSYSPQIFSSPVSEEAPGTGYVSEVSPTIEILWREEWWTGDETTLLSPHIFPSALNGVWLVGSVRLRSWLQNSDRRDRKLIWRVSIWSSLPRHRTGLADLDSKIQDWTRKHQPQTSGFNFSL